MYNQIATWYNEPKNAGLRATWGAYPEPDAPTWPGFAVTKASSTARPAKPDLTHRPLVVALQRVLQRRHERLPVAGHGRYAAAVDVDVLEDEDRGHATRERRRPAREVPLVRRFRRVALEERDGPAVGEELELQDVRVRKFGGLPVADERGDGVEAGDGFEDYPRLEPVVLEGPRAA